METSNEIIKKITPGTELRKGLEEILSAGFGALIVMGSNIILESIIRGGFKLDITYTPQKLFELSKMDGAIILSNDLKKIIYANIHLMPDKMISSKETGIRHRSAEQTSKQTNLPVIAISQRRKKITLFYNKEKQVLRDISLLLTKANHNLRILQSYRLHIDQSLDELTYNEFNFSTSIEDLTKIIQNIVSFFIHKKELDNYILELGIEGREIKESMLEQTFGLENTLKNIILDYSQKPNHKEIFNKLLETEVNLINQTYIIKLFGLKAEDDNLVARGYRILSQIPKLNKTTIEKVIASKENLNNILNGTIKDLVNEAKITENQAKILLKRLQKINENILNKL